MTEPGEQFLHKQDSKLHTTNPVKHEQARRKSAGEAISQKPADQITNWLGLIERIHTGHKDDPRVLERIKEYYHREYIIKPENIPQSYWNLQGEIAVREGRKQDLINSGVLIEETTVHDPNGQEAKKRSYIFPEEVKEQAVRTVISNQQQSLDKWIDYLISDDAPYPIWAKYWTFRSVARMGKLEKTEGGKARFATRDKGTTAPFPVLNQRALANTFGAMSARLETKGKPKDQQVTENLSTVLSDGEYQALLSTESFSRLYAQFLAEIPEYSTQGLEETRGKWVKYYQGSDPKSLAASLAGHPLEWCTADLDTARTQLEAGDFYVYYSIDENGDPIIPRLAIRMEGTRIAEPPRGIASKQNLDPYIVDVLEEKLDEFGEEGKSFKKRASDMKRLTEIEQMTQGKQDLDAEDLRFLYETNTSIDGFGYENDPRIQELRNVRNPEEDMPIVFGCELSQIARSIDQINQNTKAYVGKLVPGIFNKLSSNIEYIYTKFPEVKIRIQDITVGGKTVRELQDELVQGNVLTTTRAQSMMRSSDFTTLENSQTLGIVCLKVSDLGLAGTQTTNQIYTRAQELGLELCPAETGPYLTLTYKNQPTEEYLYIGMKPITNSHSFPIVFRLIRHDDEVVVFGDDWAGPSNGRSPEDTFVFSLPK